MPSRTGFKDMNEFSRLLFVVMGASALIVIGFGGWWVSRLDDRLIYISDTYATKTELHELKVDIKDLKRHITEEIRALNK